MEQCKAITVNGLNQRYEFGLTYLNYDLVEAYDAKYLLGIIDIFSRKAMIYKHKNKDFEPILQNIIELCLNIIKNIWSRSISAVYTKNYFSLSELE